MLRKRQTKTKVKKPSLRSQLSLITIALLGFGILMVYNASSVEAFRNFADRYYYLRYQFIWVVIGLILMLLISKINYKFYKKTAFWLYLLNLTLLVLVLVPGIGSQYQGSMRWIDFGYFVFQPSESMKLLSILYLSTWLKKEQSIQKFLFLAALPAFLVLLEPDLGTAILIFSTNMAVYFLAGGKIKNMLIIAGGAIITAILFILGSEYRRNRLLSFFEPDRDPLGSSYHVSQILLALASGGLFGLGLGQSRQKYSYLPEVATDSIFAIFAEEFGFLGSIILVFAFLYFVFLLLRIAQNCQDQFSKVLTAAVAFWFGIQIFINLSAMVALLPLTGLPLPFISYGGSSLLINLAAVGIILNISKKL